MSRIVSARWFGLSLAGWAACLLVEGLTVPWLVAEPPAPLSAQQRQEKLKERDRLIAEANRHQAAGMLVEAIAAVQKVLALDRQVFGSVSEGVVQSLERLSELYEQGEDFAAAGPARQEVLDIRLRLFGAKDWRVTDARLAMADLKAKVRMEPAQRRQLAEAARLNQQMHLLHEQHRSDAALERARRILEIRKEVLGEKHPLYATSLNDLAYLYQEQGKHSQALPLYQRALAIRKEVLGEKHPHYALSLSNLALLYKEQADYAQALPLYRQALAITKEVLGEKHPDYAANLHNLALLYTEHGDYTQALPLCQQALAIYKQTLGEKHPSYSTCLSGLAYLYEEQGDFARALPLYQQALAIRKEVQGERNPEYANVLHNLAALYHTQGDYAKAVPLYRQALAINKDVLGEKHLDYALSLHNLACVYLAQREYAKALPLSQQALAVRKELLGDKHPSYARSLNNLAMLYKAQGEYAKALPLYQQALAVAKETLGEKHPHYARALHNLAWLHVCQRQPGQALPLCLRAVRSTRSLVELTAAAQSERQQLAMTDQLRYLLDGYLSVAAAAGAPAEDSYAEVLAWKGAVAARQLAARARRQALQGGNAQAARLYEELDQAARQLAALSRSTPDPKNPDRLPRALEKQSATVERLEQALADASARWRAQQQQRRCTAAEVRALLPAGTVLVDLLEYRCYSPPGEGVKGDVWQRRLAAFVVRATQPVVRVDLGPAQRITEAVEAWRLALQRRFRTEGDAKLGDAVRQLVWVPLAEHARGARVVLISPDGALARIPFAALPGSKKDSYLLEELAVAVVPVPQLLPELLVPRPDEAKAEPSLLLVGDVRYDADPGNAAAVADSRSAPRGGALAQWKALEHTQPEVAAIKDLFQRRFRQGGVTDLREDEATEAAVRKQAPAHRYLHLATHGFFAPKELRSALAEVSHNARPESANLFGREGVAGFHPGLLSGLVLAGANRPPQPGRDDGILTALEVEALDLSGVELAVLSACETGLGEEAGGEGLLGLQRAFQVAGARSVVAGLWQVDDKATRELMVRFYENLWKRQLPKLEALRQAQLWMLKEGAGRGMSDVRVPKERLPVEDGRLPPYYWAAFALSGDWR